jgi:hypothetical protein
MTLAGCPCGHSREGRVQAVMRTLRVWIGIAALMSVTGCANGGDVTSPSPLAVATQTVPSSCAVPGAPGNLSVDVIGASVSLSWSAVGDAADYVVLVGWTPSSAETLLTNTPEAHHSIDSLPAGTHYARVHAHNWCGTSAPSDPVSFRVQ